MPQTRPPLEVLGGQARARDDRGEFSLGRVQDAFQHGEARDETGDRRARLTKKTRDLVITE
jgi:hypothetical protein